MPVFKQHEVFAGRYLLEQLIGEGGFSEVWKARDQMADDAVVAIKVYAPEKGLDEWGLRQFKNEFSLTHNLSHPHLLKVNHFDIAEGSPYLVMSYCPYGTLGDGLRKTGAYSEKQVALVMYQIGQALEEIHRQVPAIIHQDIKPDNILLMQPDTYMLGDFGISSRIRHTLSRTTVNSQALTVAYAPPERFDRHPTANAASDIFSLGVTLYEMCTNNVPWEGAGGQCLLKGARVPALPPGFSPGLRQLLEVCLSADPEKRPTATEIHQKGKYFLDTGQWPMARQKRKLAYLNTTVMATLATAGVALAATAGVLLYELEPAGLPDTLPKNSTAFLLATPTETTAKSPDTAALNSETELPKPVSNKNKTQKPSKEVSNQTSKQARTVQQERTVTTPQEKEDLWSEELIIEQPVLWEEEPPYLTLEEQALAADTQAVINTPPPTAAEAAAPRTTSADRNIPLEDRPSTSNTSIGSAKKSWFKAGKKSDLSKERRAQQKRVRKLKRRY